AQGFPNRIGHPVVAARVLQLKSGERHGPATSQAAFGGKAITSIPRYSWPPLGRRRHGFHFAAGSQPALSHDRTTAVVNSLVQERKSSANAAAFSEAPNCCCPM